MVKESSIKLSEICKTTPLQLNTILSNKYNCNVYLKREDLQPVRSFKIRGAYNNIINLENNDNGVVCASAGNHAQGFAMTCQYKKIKGEGTWFNSIIGNLVLKTHFEFGFLSAYNDKVGIPPFQRFYVGGDGLSGYSIDGREIIGLRGYPNNQLSELDGSPIYSKYNIELRYPISLNPNSTIYALCFAEAGNAWNSIEEFNPFQVKRSLGLGIRIFMPMFGIIGLDFGYGFDNVDQTGDRSGWVPQFTIGQQF